MTGHAKKWRDEFPAQLIEYMSQGLLDCEICAKFKISRDTFYDWIKNKPEFREAYQEGLPLAETKYLEFAKKKMLEGDDKGYKYWISIMNNKFRSSGWQRDSALSGTVTNIQQNINVFAQKTEAELIELLTEKLSDPTISPLLLDGSEESKE